MNTRLVLCLALVAVAFGAAHADKGLSASLDVNLSKREATAAAAQATAAAATSGVAVLSVPQVSADLSIKKEMVPLLTVSDAPCKKICAPKCTITLEKHCLTVDVPKKSCTIEKKTISKQFCEKKCKPSLKLDLPEIKLPTLPRSAPENPNPSTPPAAALAKTEAQASLFKLSKSAALSASAGATSGKVAGSVDVDASLSGVAVDAKVSASKDGRRLQGLIAAKLAMLPKADLDVECHDVCVTILFVMPEVKCTATTVQVEKCTKVPSKECKEECICLPQKSLTLALPKKPTVNLSLSKSGGL